MHAVLSNVITSEWGTASGATHSTAGAAPAEAALPEIISGTNPLVRAANRLVNLVPQIRSMLRVDDLGSLRERLVAEVRLFEQRALEAGVAQDQVVGARYCLCTVLDETAALTPWGGSGDWSRHSLLVLFHNETWGGEKYFQLLSRLAQNPQKHRDLLELMYFCIALGFEGRFRVVEGGRVQLETLRQRLAGILGKEQGGHETALSPHWQGQAGEALPWRIVPAWVVGALCAVLALSVWLVLAFRLADRSDPVFARLAAIDAPVAGRAPSLADSTDRLRGLLAAEVRAGLIEVYDDTDRSVVTLLGDGLFESGSAEISARYRPILQRVAVALDAAPGAVMVSGHTDSVPSRSIRFPSNWHLSRARADAVRVLLDGALGEPGRTRAEGRGEAEPVADNGTAEGRARNRRVEITLVPAYAPGTQGHAGNVVGPEAAR